MGKRLSEKIANKKTKAIKSSGANILASSCAGYEIQLIDGVIRHKMPVEVMHIMELLE